MAYTNVILERDAGVATITFNRPDALNALSSDMSREIARALEEVENDADSRVLVLAGSGRAFCAGEDVKERPGDSAEVRGRQTPLAKLASGEQVTIALFAMAIKAAGHEAISLLGDQVKIITDGMHKVNT